MIRIVQAPGYGLNPLILLKILLNIITYPFNKYTNKEIQGIIGVFGYTYKPTLTDGNMIIAKDANLNTIHFNRNKLMFTIRDLIKTRTQLL